MRPFSLRRANFKSSHIRYLHIVILSLASSNAGAEVSVLIERRPKAVTSVDDYSAKLQIARSLSYSENTITDSLKEYELLYQENPMSEGLLKEYVEVLRRNSQYSSIISLLEAKSQSTLEQYLEGAEIALYQKDYELSEKLFKLALAIDVKNHQATRGLILAYSWSGNYLKTTPYLESLHPVSKLDVDLLFAMARSYSFLAYYQKASEVLAELESAQLNSPEFLFELAILFAELGHVADAERIWELYSRKATEDEIIPYLKFARARMSWGDYYGAEDLVKPFIYTKNDVILVDKTAGLTELRAVLFQIYLNTERYEEASLYSEKQAKELSRLAKNGVYQNELRIAITEPTLGNSIRIPSKRSLPPKENITEEVVDGAMNSQYDPRILFVWAEHCYDIGLLKYSVQFLKKILERTPDYFPAKVRLAYLQGSSENYSESITMFDELLENFPHNRSILIGRARVLSWAKQYEEADEAYEKTRLLRPDDPIPLREQARVASWAKMVDKSLKLYELEYKQPVDMMLLELLSSYSPESTITERDFIVNELKRYNEEEQIFVGFEKYAFDDNSFSFLVGKSGAEEFFYRLNELRVEYLIQKASWLEKQAKEFKLSLKPIHAQKAYLELLAFMPWNQEALFDLAQVQCSLGLIDCSRQSYQALLELDPAHTLAQKAFAEKKLNPSPAIFNSLTYAKEEGRGELSRISRYRNQTGFEIPIADRLFFRFASDYYLEQPDFSNQSINAGGVSVATKFVLNPFLQAFMDYSYKVFEQDFRSTSTGAVGIKTNLWDYFNLELTYKRTDEVYNFFSIDQRIQADRYAATLTKLLTRELEVLARYEHLRYTDMNEGKQIDLSASYILNEHPRTFKVALGGQHRNTQEDSSSVFLEDELISIVHPYWSPHDYYLGTVTFEWLHDISEYYLCGTNSHFYDLKLIIGNDSDQNALVRYEALWNYEFLSNWQFHLKAIIHRSRDWDAEGAGLGLMYHF